MSEKKLTAEQTARTEIERIRSNATAEDQQRKDAEKAAQGEAEQRRGALEQRMVQMMELLQQVVEANGALAQEVKALAEEVRDNTEAERVPVYGRDGMPERVVLKKKPRPAATN